jgi:hypothetical protein
MANWVTIRKGSSHIYLEYDRTHTGNLSAENIRLRIGSVVAVSLDLNRNLRKRDKTTGTYMDARALSVGGLSSLTLVQVDDPVLVKEFQEGLESSVVSLRDFRLIINLEGEKVFQVVPRILGASSLQLRVP